MKSNEEIKLSIGKNIRELRIKKRLTQQELADRSRFHVTHINHIEKGTVNTPLMTLYFLSKALKTPLINLLTFDR